MFKICDTDLKSDNHPNNYNGFTFVSMSHNTMSFYSIITKLHCYKLQDDPPPSFLMRPLPKRYIPFSYK